MKRREAREKAFQYLFQLDFNMDESTEKINVYLEEHGEDAFLGELIEGVIKSQKEIDANIIEHLENWTLDRLPSVERTLLRIATYEIHYMDDIPENVTINEAVELANVFGDEKSGKFINGVLSKIIKQGGQAK